jgi:hypothetical protein
LLGDAAAVLQAAAHRLAAFTTTGDAAVTVFSLEGARVAADYAGFVAVVVAASAVVAGVVFSLFATVIFVVSQTVAAARALLCCGGTRKKKVD